MDDTRTVMRGASASPMYAEEVSLAEYALVLWRYRLALLSEGRIVLQGTPEEFLESSNEKVRAFLERDFDPNRPAAA